MDALFYDYLLEMAPNKDGFKSAYETAKGILNLSEYGPPYLEDRNMVSGAVAVRESACLLGRSAWSC